MAHRSLEAMASYAKKTRGDVPPPLVGASVTYYQTPGTSNQPPQPLILVFGGRCVNNRRVVSTMYILDLLTLTWERVQGGDASDEEVMDGEGEEEHHWPAPRYFHTADIWQDRLIVFGGMGYQSSDPNWGTNSIMSATSTSSQTPETPCVLSDIHIFDCIARRWMRLSKEVNQITPASPAGLVALDSGVAMEEGGQRKSGEPAFVAKARYAHLSAVSKGCLIIIGGQNLSNDYVSEISAFDLVKQRWTGSKVVPNEYRGSYRSVSVTSRYHVSNPAASLSAPTSATSTDVPRSNSLIRLPISVLEDGGGGDIYTFSNSNFTDVKRELQLFSPSESDNPADMSATDLTALMKGAPTTLPPGLRFPFGAILGHHLIIAGTYLSASVQQFLMWALDLWTWQWTKVDSIALNRGSWNKATLWEDQAKLVVFGNMGSNLQEDYEHRCINFDHLAFVELEIHGLYQPPLPPYTKPEYQPLALKILHSSVNSDFEVVCEDGRSVKCSRTILLHRWPWFRMQHDRAQADATDVVIAAVRECGMTDVPVTLSPARLTPRQLHLSEPYPVVLAFLEYLYSESLLTPLQHRPPILSALMMISKQYHLPVLGRLVAHSMHERLNEVTALGVYEIATLCEEMCLQVRALKIVLQIQKRAIQANHRRPPTSSASGSKTSNIPSLDHGSQAFKSQTSTSKQSGASDPPQSSSSQGTQKTPAPLEHRYRASTTEGSRQTLYSANPAIMKRASKRFSRDTMEQMPPVPSFTLPAAPKPMNVNVPTPSIAPSEQVKDSRNAPVRQSMSSPALNRIMPSQEMRSSQSMPVGLDAKGDQPEEVVFEYQPPPSASLIRSASLTSIHHFQTSEPDASAYRAIGQDPRSIRSNSSAGSTQRMRISKENVTDRSPLSATKSDSFATVSTGPGELPTPGESPGSGWPWESFHVGGRSPRKVAMKPSMEAIGEHATHQRGPSDSSGYSNDAPLDRNTPQPYRILKTSLENCDLITATMPSAPVRSKARRPPTINTYIARPHYGAKVSSVQQPPSPFSNTLPQTNVGATPMARQLAGPRTNLKRMTAWEAMISVPAIVTSEGSNEVTPWDEHEPSSTSTSTGGTVGHLSSKQQSQRRRLLSEPDKSSRPSKEKLRGEKSGIGFGRIARAMTAGAKDSHVWG